MKEIVAKAKVKLDSFLKYLVICNKELNNKAEVSLINSLLI